jgi:hypothetical protein
MRMERSMSEYSRCVEILPSIVSATYTRQTVSDPLKEGHHFDQSLGGIAGMFENIRSNTQVGLPNEDCDPHR